MPVPTFIGAGTGVAITTGTSTVSKSGCIAGNIILLHTYVAGTSGDSSRSNITNIEAIDGTDNDLNHTVFRNVGAGPLGHHLVSVGRAMTSATCSVDLTVGASGEDVFARLYEFSGVITTSTLEEVIENGGGTHDFGSDTDSTVLDTHVDTNGTNRLALNIVAISASETVVAFTGESGGDWSESIAEFATGTGATATLSLQIADMPNAGQIDGGSFSLSGSRSWGIQGFALVGTADAPEPSPSDNPPIGILGRGAGW